MLADGDGLRLTELDGLTEAEGLTLADGLDTAGSTSNRRRKVTWTIERKMSGYARYSGLRIGTSTGGGPEGDGLTDGLTELDGETELEGLTLGDGDGLTLGETDDDGETDADGLTDGDTDELGDGDGLGEGETDGLSLLDGLTDALGDGLSETEDEGLEMISRTAKWTIALSSLVPDVIPTLRLPCPAVVSRTPTKQVAPTSSVFNAVEFAPLVGGV